MNEKTIRDFIEKISNDINDIVFRGIYEAIQNNPTVRKKINPAFPYPKELKIGILNNYLAIEYVGPESPEDDKVEIIGSYQPNNSIFDFLDIDLKHLNSISLSANTNIENMSFFWVTLLAIFQNISMI